MPLSKPGKDSAAALLSPLTLISTFPLCYGSISMPHLLFHVSLPLDFYFLSFLILSPPSVILLSDSQLPLPPISIMHFGAPFGPPQTTPVR